MKRLTSILFGIVSIILLSSFFSFIFGNSISEKRKIAIQITDSLGKKLKKKYGLRFKGISEAAEDGKYKIIGVELDYRKTLTKDEGRILLLNCAHDVLEAFNSYPQFRQYMANVPFTGANIIITIYVHPEKNYDVKHPDIAVFSFHNDILWYKTHTRESLNNYEYYTEVEEPYEEALKIVEAQARGKLPFSGK